MISIPRLCKLSDKITAFVSISVQIYFFKDLFFSFFCQVVDSEEEEVKQGEGMTCNKVPRPNSNHGHCSYVACTVTIQLPDFKQKAHIRFF